MTKIEQRVNDLENNLGTSKRIIVATQDNNGGLFTLKGDPKQYTEAQLDQLDMPDTLLIKVCHVDMKPGDTDICDS